MLSAIPLGVYWVPETGKKVNKNDCSQKEGQKQSSETDHP
jgi:hypothetical protein